VKWYRLAAEQGYARAQWNVGRMYTNGIGNGFGVRKNNAEAAKWYRLAAEQGHSRSQFNLGMMYMTGEGVRKNNAESMKWHRKSADRGDDDVQDIFKRVLECAS